MRCVAFAGSVGEKGGLVYYDKSVTLEKESVVSYIHRSVESAPRRSAKCNEPAINYSRRSPTPLGLPRNAIICNNAINFVIMID